MTACPIPNAPDLRLAAWLDRLTADLTLRPEMRHALAQYVRALAHPSARPHDVHALAAAVGASPDSFHQLLADARWSSRSLQHALLRSIQSIPALQWHANGVLVIRATGSHKRGPHLPYVGQQLLPEAGHRDRGRVTLLTFWSAGTLAYPLQLAPVTPPDAPRTFAAPVRSSVALALHLCTAATRHGVPFSMVVGDLLNDGDGDLASALDDAGTDYALTTPLHRAAWPPHARGPVPTRPPRAVAQRLPLGAWQQVAAPLPAAADWFVAELLPLPTPLPHRDWPRLLVLTSDPRALPPATTWAISTNLSPHVHDLAAIVQYARWRQPADTWMQHARTTLGFDAYRGRSAIGLRRHQALVCVAAAAPLVEPYLPPPPGPTTGRVTPRTEPRSGWTMERAAALAELLRRHYGVPPDHAAVLGKQFSRRSALRQIFLQWHKDHDLRDDLPAAQRLLALLGTTPLLPLPALGCLTRTDRARAVQLALAPVTDTRDRAHAAAVRVYRDRSRLAVAEATASRTATGALQITQASDVFEVAGADRPALVDLIARVVGSPTDWDERRPRSESRRWPTERSGVLLDATERWTLVLWEPVAAGSGAWELVGEARPVGLVAPWDDATDGPVIDRRWVVAPATLPLAADWILYGAALRQHWRAEVAGSAA